MITWMLSLCMFGAVAQTMPVASTQTQPAGVGAAQSQSIQAPAVWVIGEGFRVDPLTGRVREERRLGGNPIPADFDYVHKNLAWHAAAGQAGRITLNAARNEMVACQVQIRGPASGVTVTCSDLKGPAVIDAARDVEILKEWYLNVTKNSTNQDSTTAGYNMGTGWYADALIPVTSTGGFGQPFDIPDRMNNIPGQRWQSIWVDIYVPRDVPPGRVRRQHHSQWRAARQACPADHAEGPRCHALRRLRLRGRSEQLRQHRHQGL